MNPAAMAAAPAKYKDQATALRDLVSDKKDVLPPRDKTTGMMSIAVLSGKGGVGKSNVSVNLALALADKGLDIAILDADLGLANIDILFGVTPKFNLGHVMRGEKELSEVVLKVGERLSIIPGGVGLRDLAEMDEQSQSWMINRMSSLEEGTDLLIIDVSAGIHKNVLSFAMSADMVVLITTPEPTAIRDSYGVLKSLCQATNGAIRIGLLVNMASDVKEALLVAKRIISAGEQFLNFKTPYLGCVLWDLAIRESVKKRKPLLLNKAESVSSQYFRALAQKIYELSEEEQLSEKTERRDTFLLRLLRQGGNGKAADVRD
ncbi:MAG: MinD/ParA family protein [Synergistaceae bacterium]|jgi:flagellar biosynthesis protein FlhG|nr:MinD/ParA family protein [Synergistaceae bacterium]